MKFICISPFTSISGSAIRFYNIAQNLQLKGHDVIYVERRPRGEPRPSLPHIKYYSTPKFKNLFIDILISTLYNLFIVWIHRDALIFFALKPAPNNGLAALFARKMDMKLILDIDDLDFGYFPKGIKRKISSYFFNKLPRHFDLVTCHTEKLQHYISQTLLIPRDKIHFLPQGVSPHFLSYNPADKPSHLPRSIVYCATLGITSDVSDLFPLFFRLCRDYADLRIRIIGDGVKKTLFQQKVQALGLATRIEFCGRVPHTSLPALLADNWIGINYMRPSTTNECRAILKIREYLAVGLQVVCNDVGDGYMFKDFIELSSTIDGMEGRMRRILDSPYHPRWDGREFLEKHYAWDGIIDEFLGHARALARQTQLGIRAS